MSFENNQDEEPATQVKPLAEYKTGSKWKPFKDGAIAYFNSIKGFHNSICHKIKRTQTQMQSIRLNIID
jgi:hypothetical protein